MAKEAAHIRNFKALLAGQLSAADLPAIELAG